MSPEPSVMMTLKRLARDFLPPVVVRFYGRKRRNQNKGDYPTWKAAARVTHGYGNPSILAAVHEATRKVVRGEAKYERDQVLFNDDVKRWPVIGALFRQALTAPPNKSLVVMDFGGSLGSTYYQIRDVVEEVVKLRWVVIDQETFVAAGKAEFATEILRFRASIGECLSQDEPSVALLSSVLPFLEEPYVILEEILAAGLPTIIIDRTPLVEGSKDRLTVQYVPEILGGGSYPAWFLSRGRLEAVIRRDYTILSTFESLDGTWRLSEPFDLAASRGYVLVKK
jgi:putative methyltransferase (TIGR04325 family)